MRSLTWNMSLLHHRKLAPDKETDSLFTLSVSRLLKVLLGGVWLHVHARARHLHRSQVCRLGALIACKIDCGASVIHHIRHLLTKSSIGIHIHVKLLSKDSTWSGRKTHPLRNTHSGTVTIGRRRREPQEQQLILLRLTFVCGDNQNFQALFRKWHWLRWKWNSGVKCCWLTFH